jgi:hypothetical protein
MRSHALFEGQGSTDNVAMGGRRTAFGNGPGVLRKAVALLGLLVVGAVLLVSCEGTGFRYPQNTETRTFFKVPEAWALFGEEELFPEGAAGGDDPILWAVGFAADPGDRPAELFDLAHDRPRGLAVVYRFTAEERDNVSLRAIRNTLIPVDQIAEQQPERLQVLSASDVVVEGGIHGNHLVFSVESATGEMLTVNQIGLVDPETENLYFFAIGCLADCYRANRSLIEQIAGSWTVKER